jgi:hypothetical protein
MMTFDFKIVVLMAKNKTRMTVDSEEQGCCLMWDFFFHLCLFGFYFILGETSLF